MVTDLLLRGETLDTVWRQTESGLEFVRKAKFRGLVDVIVSQQRFILNMQGQTSTFSSFSGVDFDEAAFEAELNDEDRMTTMVCWYWILKIQARVISGDYDTALAAGQKAKDLLWASIGHIQVLDYYFYSALAAAALLEDEGSPETESALLDLLTTHLEQLREWAENGSATFRDKFALTAAELARIERRDLDAMHLYEEAIRLARENGFVQNEEIANELAARFYITRGFDKIGRVYLRDARHCYLLWGARGKVRQLDGLYPYLREDEPIPAPTRTIGEPVEHLDLATVIKVSQAVSGEIVREKLLDTLMRTAMEQAGAERALLILARGAGATQQIAAEATTQGDTVTVQLRDDALAENVLPESVLHHVLRTRECVILDDAAARSPFATDCYIRERQARSVLCLPLLNQAQLIGVLYFENNLASHVFSRSRLAVLKLLASQAAIALENTHLYRDLAEREAKVRRLVDSDVIGICIWDLDGPLLDSNDAFLRMLQYDRNDLKAGLRWIDMTPPEWQEVHALQELEELKATGTMQAREKEFFRKDGSRVPVLIGAAAFEGQPNQGVAYILDLTERKRAEAQARESEKRYREVQADLAHANRVATTGQLSASIAHEVNQPLTALMTNTQAAVRWLEALPPNLEEVRDALASVVRNGKRASDVIGRIRALITKTPPRRDRFEINEAIHEVIGLALNEAEKNGVLVRTQFAERLPPIDGDRVQLQQVILNMIVNAIEAMSAVDDGPRALLISTEKVEAYGLLVSVQDLGPGLAPGPVPEVVEHVFDAFYTTKSDGMGMGLSICRTIIEAHGGRVWARPNKPRGATFQFNLPIVEPFT